jgi:hypothetical protein
MKFPPAREAISLIRSCPPLVRPLPPKATAIIKPDFRCIQIQEYYFIVPLKRVEQEERKMEENIFL